MFLSQRTYGETSSKAHNTAHCNENELLTCKVLVYAITSGEIVKLIARVVTSE